MATSEKNLHKIDISILIPVYNEQESLPNLFAALWPVVEKLGRSFEVIFINDGSKDKSLEMLTEFYAKHKEVRVIDLGANFGQHMALLAGFEHARGDKLITLDADLQNPPEEIPRLVEALYAGHDVVGTYRVGRQDPIFRKVASKLVNKTTNRIARLSIKDYGCMLRGYDRHIVDIINQSHEASTFIPALAQKFAASPVELSVSHREREFGESKYGLFQLIRLNFDLMANFSLVPLQAVTMAGMVFSALAVLDLVYMFVRRLILGIDTWQLLVEHTFEALGFLLSSLILFSLGVIGEYIGRIYQEVRSRPHYSLRKIYEWENEE